METSEIIQFLGTALGFSLASMLFAGIALILIKPKSEITYSVIIALICLFFSFSAFTTTQGSNLLVCTFDGALAFLITYFGLYKNFKHRWDGGTVNKIKE